LVRSQGLWAIIDQSLCSATNFGVGVIVARTLGAEGFGDFAIAFAVWFTLLGVIRALLIQPYVIDAAPRDPSCWRESTARAAGAVVLAGVICGIGSLGVGALLGVSSSIGGSFCILGLAAPTMALHDLWRHAAFARGRARQALGVDLSWATVQGLGLGCLVSAGALTAPTALAAWGAGGMAGALVGSRIMATCPRWDASAIRFGRSLMRLGAWFTASHLILLTGAQAAIFIVAGVVGRAAVGGLRAATNVFAPVQLLQMAAESVGLPEAARAAQRGLGPLRRTALIYSGSLTGFAVLYGVVPVLAGEWTLRTVFGPEFVPFADLMLPMVVMHVCGACSSGALCALRAAQLARPLTAAETGITIVRVALVLLLVSQWGLEGAGWGLACAAATRSVILWGMLYRAREKLRGEIEPGIATDPAERRYVGETSG